MGQIAKRPGFYKGSAWTVLAVALLVGLFQLPQPADVHASVDPGLDSGNAVVDRTSIPGRTILKYETTGDSTFRAPGNVTDARVLVVGGGGGGGSNGGGGGAGRVVSAPSMSIAPGQNYDVTIGNGGGGGTSSNSGATNGGSSSIANLAIAPGGGGGGSNTSGGSSEGNNGGSGGGAARDSHLGSGGLGNQAGTTPPGGASSGNNGGGTNPACNDWCGAGGGGGAATAGGNGNGDGSQGASEVAGSGGNGIANDITGTSTLYGAGGGGGRHSSGAVGQGGSGGGGNGSVASGQAGHGATNTGSGGGGGGFQGTGGNGGSGIVIISFETQEFPDAGGVATAFTWLRADDGVSSGAEWQDFSGSNRSAVQNNATNQPSLDNNAINFNPAFQFDGTNHFMSITDLNYNASAAGEDIFAVVLPNSTSGDRNFVGFGTTASTNNVTEMRYTNDRLQYGAGPPWTPLTNPTVTAGKPQITNGHRFSDTSSPAKLLVDGAEVASGSVGAYPTLQQLNIGARRHNTNNDQRFSGQIAEVIYYDREVTADERQRVASYLAIKYGITLDHNYSSSADTTIWNKANNNPYNNDIAGVGRDDESVLNQKQSKSINSGSIVTIGHGDIAATNQDNNNDFANDQAFMLWGNDGAGIDQTVDVGDTEYKRMSRIWRTEVVNDAGDTKVQIPDGIITRDNAVLLVSDSPTFDDSAQAIDMTHTGSDYEATTTFSNGTHYFTFASTAGADVEFVSKTATDTEGNAITDYTPGGSLKYVLTVRNNGPDLAGEVEVTDTLPADMTPTAASGGGWSCDVDGQDVTCTRPSLGVGVTAPAITIDATTASSATGQKTNDAQASTDNDPDLSNNSASVTLGAAPKADLSITKRDVSTPVAGEDFDYEFVVTNSGPSDTPSFTISDTLPADLTFVSSDPAAACSAVGQDVTCTGDPLARSQPQTITITVSVDPGYGGDPLENTATVAPPAGVTDPNMTNNSSTNSTDVDVETDLEISKSHVGNFIAGDDNDFTIAVTNHGPSAEPANDITVTDVLPDGMEYSSFSGVDWSCDETDGTVTCTYANSLAPSQTRDFTLTVAVDPLARGQIENTAEVSGTTPDPDLTNNTDSDTVNVIAEADLALTKTASGAFTAGQQGQFDFEVTNNGPSTDTPSFTVDDTLDSEFTFAGTVPGGDATCQANGQDVTCTGGSVEVGETLTFSFLVDIDQAAAGQITNSATVIPPDGTDDPNPANNTSTINVDITPNADLGVEKTHPGQLIAGANEDYTITVTNHGPTDVDSFTVTDVLDPNFTYVSSSPDICSATGQTVTCTGVALADQANTDITLTVAVASNAVLGLNVDNTASVAVPNDINDPNPDNNQSTTTNAIGAEADLAMSKTHTGDFRPGNTATYTLEVTNNGPSDVDVYTVNDVLPSQLTYVPGDTGDANCQVSGQTVTCSGGTITSGSTDTITLMVEVDPSVTAGTSIDNSATVTSAATDPNPNNNTDDDTATVAAAEADLTATKTAQDDLMAGTSVTYRFEVTNDGGPDAAGNVTISDTLPGYLSYQSFSSVDGDWSCGASGQDVTCTLPILAVDATGTVDVTVLVAQDAPDPVENSATVTFNGTGSANPSTSDPVDYEADLELQLTHESKTYFAGDTVTFTYTVINHGPSAARDVVLSDTLPDGLTFESIVAHTDTSSTLALVADTLLMSSAASAAPNTPFDCSNSGQDVTCTTDLLFVGTYDIAMTAQINDDVVGDLTTTASITSSTFDPNPDNNFATDTVVDIQPAPSGAAGLVHGLTRGLAETGSNFFAWLVLAGISISSGIGWYMWRRKRALG